MPDQTLCCKECRTNFTFSEGEQGFYQEKGFTPPIRCPECRQRRKAERVGVQSGFGFRQTGGQHRGW